MPSDNKPRFSVVIPTYNRARSIVAAVSSVLRQTYPAHEILVVDDGSTDETEKVLAAIGDRRIRYLAQANRGATSARNLGVASATGTHIAYLDSDDCFAADHLARATYALREGANVAVYGKVQLMRGAVLTTVKPTAAISDGEHVAEYIACRRGWVPTSTLVLPLHTATAVGWTDGLRYGQDVDYAIRLGAIGTRFVMLEDISAFVSDADDPTRVSTRAKGDERLQWIDDVRGLLTPKSYHAFRGLAARPYARAGEYRRAAALYSAAVLHGVWRPGTALRIGLQVFAPPTVIRAIARCSSRIRELLQ